MNGAASGAGVSSRDVAEQFEASPSHVIKVWKGYAGPGKDRRATTLATPRKLSEAQHAAVRERVLEQRDATLPELRAWVRDEHGV